ncbi:hypothetical protein BMI76_07345 [Streptococcus sp. 'caviae']|nr:hypothetical protein BMI76_07345 [Streptococcus sp. 'caviae']
MKSSDVKETFANALLELSKQRSVEKITVVDIVCQCNMSRRTFYNHFIDKYDLIGWIYISRVDKILSCFNKTETWEQCVISTYQSLFENSDYFLCVINQEGQNSFYRQFVSHTYEYMRGIILSYLKLDKLPEELDYALTAHTYGQVNCALKWMREGMILSPIQMARYNIDNMPYLLKRFFLKSD